MANNPIETPATATHQPNIIAPITSQNDLGSTEAPIALSLSKPSTVIGADDKVEKEPKSNFNLARYMPLSPNYYNYKNPTRIKRQD
jgi:hypothetical protein